MKKSTPQSKKEALRDRAWSGYNGCSFWRYAKSEVYVRSVQGGTCGGGKSKHKRSRGSS
jgi:hypothetical protein